VTRARSSLPISRSIRRPLCRTHISAHRSAAAAAAGSYCIYWPRRRRLTFSHDEPSTAPVAPSGGRVGSFPHGWTSKNYVICVRFHCDGTSSYHTTNTLHGRRAKSHVDTQTSYSRPPIDPYLTSPLLQILAAPLSAWHDTHITVPGPGWRRPHRLAAWRAVVSGVRRMNQVNARRARLVPGLVTVFGRVYHLGM